MLRTGQSGSTWFTLPCGVLTSRLSGLHWIRFLIRLTACKSIVVAAAVQGGQPRRSRPAPGAAAGALPEEEPCVDLTGISPPDLAAVGSHPAWAGAGAA
jgi:hypothetical protein